MARPLQHQATPLVVSLRLTGRLRDRLHRCAATCCVITPRVQDPGVGPVFSTRGRDTTWREEDRGVAVSANNPAGADGVTMTAFATTGVIPRSRIPCWSSASSRFASSISNPSSASSRAEPTWRTIRRRPATDSAICTAVAPEAVRTLRTQATSRSYRPRISALVTH